MEFMTNVRNQEEVISPATSGCENVGGQKSMGSLYDQKSTDQFEVERRSKCNHEDQMCTSHLQEQKTTVNPQEWRSIDNSKEQRLKGNSREEMPLSIQYYSTNDAHSQDGTFPDSETVQIKFVSDFSKGDHQHHVTSNESVSSLRTSKIYTNPNMLQNKEHDQPFCVEHEEEILCMFCVECKVPVCRNCIIENHPKHNLDKVENHVDINQSNAAKFLDKLVTQFRLCQKEIKNLDNQKDFYCGEVVKLIFAFNENRDKLKSDIDRVTDDLICYLKNREKIDLENLNRHKKYFESKLREIRESITCCEKQLLSKNEVDLTVIVPEIDHAPPHNDIFIPPFSCKIPHKLYLQSHVGFLSAFPIMTFYPQTHLNIVTTLNSNEALFASHGKTGIYKITKDGTVVKRIKTMSVHSMFLMEDISVGDIAVTSDKIILISEFQGTQLWKGPSDSGRFELVKNFHPFLTQGICTDLTSCDIFICLNLKSKHQINRISLNGDIIQTISFAGSMLTRPMKIKVSKNGHMFILQQNYTQKALDLVVMDTNGHVIHVQKAIGRHKSPSLFTYDLAIDKYENVLISNYDKSRLYLYDVERKSLRYVLLKLHSDKTCKNKVTTGISLDQTGLLWTCNCYDDRDTLKTQVSIMKF